MSRPNVIAILALTLAGCASVPMGDLARDAELKTFSASAEKAGIYVYRNESIGTGVKMYVEIDGMPIGRTAPMTYLFKELPPGTHTVTSIAENNDTLRLDIKPGTLAYVRQEIKTGVFYARSKLHLMSETEGKKGVMQTRLAIAEDQAPAMQNIEVRVQAEDPAWKGPLDCEASNARGSWQFAAPGRVIVLTSASPLRLACKAPTAAANTEVSIVREAKRQSMRNGSATGAKIGAGAGTVLGIAAAPVMGPAFAVLLAAGGALRGAEIGSVADAVAGDRLEYPTPIVLQVRYAAPPN